MKKFEGILLCTDLDDTLLTTDKRVSSENLKAIEHFKNEGGMFTFVTGRTPLGIRPVLEQVTPNAPPVCFNGGAVYDIEQKKALWSRWLDDGAIKAAEFIDKSFKSAGIEICTSETVYFSKVNRITEEHKVLESFPDNYVDYREIKERWNKVIFMVETEEMPALKEMIAKSPFADRYSFTQSSPWYYELLPKGSNKGSGLKRLIEILDIPAAKVIAAGDNENDIEMLLAAGTGIAVANAVPIVKRSADHITDADNDRDAIAEIIRGIESGELYPKP